MPTVQQKTVVGDLVGTPDKRMFWSIINDYDIETAICELIDNAIDLWKTSNVKKKLIIDLHMDIDRQIIVVKDNAGGVALDNLKILISPGSSLNSPDAETIGIFGVGSKRAVITLAENIVIKTHMDNDKTYQIDIDKDWLESPEWIIPFYEIPDIDVGTTTIELTALRKQVTREIVDNLILHLGQIYSWFIINNDINLSINTNRILPIVFDNWAYPKGHEPIASTFEVDFKENGKMRVFITGGLILDRDPGSDNYGVYFYCNNRLIAKELKVREVGYYITSEAGVPHPDSSLCRVLVCINGKAKLMPWNSSKTDINYSHDLFKMIRTHIIRLVSHYSSLSRRLKDDWQSKVFKFKEGAINDIQIDDIASGKLVLPQLPRINKTHLDYLRSQNKQQLANQPWAIGLLESIAMVEIVQRQRIETKNRIALILLDSNFEIALKEFIVHRTDLYPVRQYTDSRIKHLFNQRHLVVREIQKHLKLTAAEINIIEHYYMLRNKLIHERATVGVTDRDIAIYGELVQSVINKLFRLNFK